MVSHVKNGRNLEIITSYNCPSSKATGNRVLFIAKSLTRMFDNIKIISNGSDISHEPIVENSKINFTTIKKRSEYHNLILRGVSEIIHSLKIILSTNKKSYTIITIPSIFLLIFYSLIIRKNFILDIRDITWDYLAKSKFPINFFGIIFKYLFKLSLKKCLFITVTNDKEKNLVSNITKKSIYVLPNGIEKEKFLTLINNRENYKNSHMKKILYVGNIGKAQNLKLFINVVANLKNYKAHLVGNGNELEYLKKYSLNENFKNIIFHGLLPWKQIIKFYYSSDILFLQIDKNYKSAIPSKIFEYALVGKPIIACVPEGPAKEILKSFSGINFCDPNDPQQILKSINQIDIKKLNIDCNFNRSIIEQKYLRDNYTSFLNDIFKRNI